MVTGVRCAYKPPGGSIRHLCSACGRLFTLQRHGAGAVQAMSPGDVAETAAGAG